MAITWEYKIISSKDAEGGNFLVGKSRSDVEAYLNDLGRQGWEIIQIDFPDLSISAATPVFAGLARRPIVGGLPRPSGPPGVKV